jgi:hypothetical protein
LCAWLKECLVRVELSCVGRNPIGVLVVSSAFLLSGCAIGGQMSADELEEFLTSGQAFQPERGYTAPVCVDGSDEASDWDYVCTYTIDGQPWHFGVNVSGDHPSDQSGAVPTSEPLRPPPG